MPGPGEIEPRKGRCARCFLQTALCICNDLSELHTDTRIVLVRHALEQTKHSNTGRLVELMMPNHALLTHGVAHQPLDTSELEGPDTWLLFPEGEPRQIAPERVARLVVLDGTWGQARRMRQRIEALRGMPILSVKPGATAQRRLRRAPTANSMATIEAIARALEIIEGPEPARRLREAFDLMVERSAGMGRY